jgi:DNA-binding response OmpR family regulator
MSELPTILIVEDSPTQAEQLAGQLAQRGLNILLATDGPEALRTVDEHQPAAVILDVNLPSMSGYQVCRRLKRDENTAHIPVIMLTSSDSSDDTLRGLNVGATDYIPKDAFATDNLVATLQGIGVLT